MIASIFHTGSGIGNQLHRYVMCRVLAFDKGFDFGMMYPENFKGKTFINIDMGVKVEGGSISPDSTPTSLPRQITAYMREKAVYADRGGDKVDIRPYDWDMTKVSDNTLIDGEFQGERYYQHRLGEIREWLKVELLKVPEDVCIINFRGGEYVGVEDLFLPWEYWDEAIDMMIAKGITKFEVHTDDTETAHRFFPDFTCIHDVGLNWRSIRYAKNLIISNSSFAILPALLGEAETIISPKFWAGRNKGYQQLEQNIYKRFTPI